MMGATPEPPVEWCDDCSDYHPDSRHTANDPVTVPDTPHERRLLYSARDIELLVAEATADLAATLAEARELAEQAYRGPFPEAAGRLSALLELLLSDTPDTQERT